MMPDLPVYLWLETQLRALAARGDFYTILRRGDAESGLILLKIRSRAGVSLFEQGRGASGNIAWIPVKITKDMSEIVEESALDAYIARATARDPDLWAVEIETAHDAFPVEGPVLNI